MLSRFRPARTAGAAPALAAAILLAPGAIAHPHVFVDGGIDFTLDREAVLQALQVTWRFDEFETLYMLSAHGIGLDGENRLAEADRAALAAYLSDWPAEFTGSAHLSVEERKIALATPTDLDVTVEEGRLVMRFTRALETPEALAGRMAEVAFYEATYFYAFTIDQMPQVAGDDAARCSTRFDPFEPDKDLQILQTTLFELGREETPAVDDVGSLFADRIFLECV